MIELRRAFYYYIPNGAYMLCYRVAHILQWPALYIETIFYFPRAPKSRTVFEWNSERALHASISAPASVSLFASASSVTLRKSFWLLACTRCDSWSSEPSCISNVMECSQHSLNWLHDWKAFCFYCASVCRKRRKTWKSTVLRLFVFRTWMERFSLYFYPFAGVLLLT